MSIFGRRKQTTDGPSDGRSWLREAHTRFERGKGSHFGSPETMRLGGDNAMAKGDAGAAMFYYAKAIDIAQTWMNSRPGERSIEDDMALFQSYVNAVRMVLATHRDADVLSDDYNENGTTSAHYMVQLTNAARMAGQPTQVLDAAIDEFIALTGMTTLRR